MRSNHKKPAAARMAGSPEISVIIPALNEERYLGRTLKWLSRQTFKDFETIVADGGSTDGTRQIARKYSTVIIEKRRGAGSGRNAGASRAHGRILVFLDADTKPSRTLLYAYHAALSRDGVVAATGPIRPLERASRKINLGFRLVSVLLVRASILVGRPSIVGSNFAVKKDVFNKVGGFKGHMMTYEDWDLSNRLKKVGKIRYAKDALAYTSARRVLAWGVYRYFTYHLKNFFLYHLYDKPRSDYVPVR